jgi:hypothetical protein
VAGFVPVFNFLLARAVNPGSGKSWDLVLMELSIWPSMFLPESTMWRKL